MPTENTEDNVVLVECYGCGSSFDEQDTYLSPVDEEHRCDDCHADFHGYCDDCSSECEASSMTYVDSRGEDVCDDCSYYYRECDVCSETYHEDDMHYDDRTGDNMCENCHEYNSGCVEDLEWEVHSNEYVQTHHGFVGLQYRSDDNLENPRNDLNPVIKTKRAMGVEIETNFNSNVDNVGLQEYVTARLSSDRRMDGLAYRDHRAGVRVTYDGSITGGDHSHGSEIILEPRRNGVLEQDLKTVTECLKSDFGAYISRKCGYHLHIDSRDYDWYHFAVLTLMTKVIEPHIFSWVPSSRRSSSWCRPVSQPLYAFRNIYDRDSFVDFYYDDGAFNFDRYHSKRYHGLNLHSHFGANQGIELRYHSGTLNAEKMIHWSSLWGCIIDKCYDLGNQVRTEMRDKHTSDFWQSEMMKSLMNTGIDKLLSEEERTKYYSKYRSKERNADGHILIDGDYVLDESILNSKLKLDDKKFYSIFPLLRQIQDQQTLRKPCMTINSMFEYFEIPTETQDFYRVRSVELLNSQSDGNHIESCFRDVSSFIEFKDGKFTHKDLLLKSRIPTVNILDGYDDNHDYTIPSDINMSDMEDYLLVI